MQEAVERTGLTARQLRLRKRRGEIRWRFVGRYLEFPEPDVAALEAASWHGGPVVVTRVCGAGRRDVGR